MAAAASGPNTEIPRFDWFISGWIFPVLLIILKEKNLEFLHILRPNRDLWRKMQLWAIRLGIELAISRI